VSESESVSERELAQYFADEVFSGKPRSVGEALADEAPPEPEALPEADTPSPEGEPPVVIQDAPPDAALPEQPPAEGDTGEGQPEGEIAPEEGAEPVEEELEEDDNVVWAKRKYGFETIDPRIAKIMRDQEQHISRQAAYTKELEQFGQQMYEREQQQLQQPQAQMPLSAQEEQWIEQSLQNPMEYARQAVWNGNFSLYHGILNRVSEEHGPVIAGQIAGQVQGELAQAAQMEREAQQQQNGAPPMEQAFYASFDRLGLEPERAIAALTEQVNDLPEYDSYRQALIGPDDRQRDLAIRALYERSRSGALTKRRVRDEQRAEQIKREGELRREAAGVVQGSPHVPPAKEDSPFMQAMEAEWRARGQWTDAD